MREFRDEITKLLNVNGRLVVCGTLYLKIYHRGRVDAITIGASAGWAVTILVVGFDSASAGKWCMLRLSILHLCNVALHVSFPNLFSITDSFNKCFKVFLVQFFFLLFLFFCHFIMLSRTICQLVQVIIQVRVFHIIVIIYIVHFA